MRKNFKFRNKIFNGLVAINILDEGIDVPIASSAYFASQATKRKAFKEEVEYLDYRREKNMRFCMITLLLP